MDYMIEVGQFSGPFDLLFHLIEINEIDLHDLPISKITAQYIEHLNHLNSIDLDNLSEFLLLASTLLEIKSKMLLPDANETGNDSEEDPRDELVQKLIEYSKYKKLSAILDKREQDFSKALYRKNPPADPSGISTKIHHDVEFDFTEKALLNALAELLSKLDSEDMTRKRYFQQIAPDTWTVEDKIEHLRKIFGSRGKITFEMLFQSDSTRSEIITTFLALLELIRTGEVSVLQRHTFDSIQISKNEAGETTR